VRDTSLKIQRQGTRLFNCPIYQFTNWPIKT